jgi:peptidoglycan/xylan/chitin deacetylase (PgdA/CDA1 family)
MTIQPVSLLFHDVFVRHPGESGFSSPAADRYKLSLPEFDAQIAGLAEYEKSGGNTAGPARITVDDGGVSYYTAVADRLEAHGWRGYCFVSTAFIGASGFLSIDQVRELDARGHIIGSHSASHPGRFSKLSEEEMHREWVQSRRVLEDLLGHPVTVASVPGGYFSRAVATTAAAAGLQLLFTSEPVHATHCVSGCTIAGRFAVRHGAPRDFCQKLLRQAPWTRYGEWARWNAKGLVKPLLGSTYPHVANWIHSRISNPALRGAQSVLSLPKDESRR